MKWLHFRSLPSIREFDLLNNSNGCIEIRYNACTLQVGGLDSAVGSVTATVWMVRGPNSIGARFSLPIQTGVGASPVLATMGNGCVSQEKSGQGEALTNHAHIVPGWSKSKSINLIFPLWLQWHITGWILSNDTVYRTMFSWESSRPDNHKTRAASSTLNKFLQISSVEKPLK